MAYDERSLDDYIDVAQRIADFRVLYPEGSLQPADPARPWEIAYVNTWACVQCTGRRSVKSGQNWKTCPRCQGTGVRSESEGNSDTFVVYTAAAYRREDDGRPGIGVAWEPYPGRTPYTAGSELMNAETSAWGRAIIAVLASDSKGGVASRQEVKARRAERDDGLPVNKDGSLSRSQTSDEEKSAAGVMTAGQLAEHTALQAKRADQAQPAERAAGTPPDDPWYVRDAVEDAPGSSLPSQRQAIAIALAKTGHASPEASRAECSRIIGRTVESRKDLSYTEAIKVLAETGKAAGDGES